MIPARSSSPRSPADVEAASALAATGEVVALLGAPDHAGMGRYGVVGRPGRVTSLPDARAVATAIDAPATQPRVLLVGYELGAELVHLDPTAPPRGQAKALLFELEAGVVVDHTTGATRAFPASWEPAPAVPPCSSGPLRFEPVVSDSEHARRVAMVQAHIARGDIYQGNLTRRLRVHGSLVPEDALTRLHGSNPVPHGAYLRLQRPGCRVELLSNSMETLLQYDAPNARAATFPIKGTAARGATPMADRQARTRLAADPKERAEHVMIVDLCRNDLGRVCALGSVHVPELMALRGYYGVWHGVSEVRGTLAPQHTPGQLFAALFPGGSITGAPKRRALEILRDIEQEPRGYYTGSLCLLWPDGSISASILIRTLVRDDEGWSLNVGGGVVADSVPDREVAETWHKVEVFRARLGGAGRGTPK